ncbi:Ohr family peroxiredoxin [Psittacicella hinzii]|uniref:Organic hydroperoxide resistance protein n=1 Tax=Psittacicella hinzii TaxID=2028575 RepID=A0A3A1YTT4_9GAMM|nr:Ohr family peroxiredoxin [Psittacicella hinzii]RIY40598.1 organic hydroperoxide resistance protein [Psittacicella hinzii]
MKVFYQTSATSVGGRSGVVKTDDGSLEFELTAFNSGHEGVNPEKLFAMGYAACFDSAANLVAQQMELPVTSIKTNVHVGIGQVLGGAFALEVAIKLYTQGLTQEQAQALVERAHQVCPYSNATRNNIQITVEAIAE